MPSFVLVYLLLMSIWYDCLCVLVDSFVNIRIMCFRQTKFLVTVATTSSDVCIINAFSGWSCSLCSHHDKIEGSRLENEGY
jgi:hypothetical protein